MHALIDGDELDDRNSPIGDSLHDSRDVVTIAFFVSRLSKDARARKGLQAPGGEPLQNQFGVPLAPGVPRDSLQAFLRRDKAPKGDSLHDLSTMEGGSLGAPEIIASAVCKSVNDIQSIPYHRHEVEVQLLRRDWHLEVPQRTKGTCPFCAILGASLLLDVLSQRLRERHAFLAFCEVACRRFGAQANLFLCWPIHTVSRERPDACGLGAGCGKGLCVREEPTRVRRVCKSPALARQLAQQGLVVA